MRKRKLQNLMAADANLRLLWALLCATAVTAASAQSLPGWDLVWSDEFVQADGTAPDPAKWGYDVGGGGWGNNELEYYTSRTNNARIESGQLVIEAREENYGGRDYTSARLLTKNKWSWTYGRIEARIKLPRGQGIWPAFWMLGANIDTAKWPTCGETDIMEYIGRESRVVYGTIHGPGYSGGGGIGGSYTYPAGVGVADDFHVFAVEWETNSMRWYVDSNLYFTATPASLPNGTTWVFTEPQFLLLNVAVGGNWPGYPDGTTVFPQQMLVDYVRVYARTNETGVNLLQNPGFESGALAPWVGYSPPGGANTPGGYVESTNSTYYNGGNPGGSNVLTHSGTYVSKTFGDFSGAENYDGFYQDVPAEPGSLWSADGWVLSHEQDLLSGYNSSWIEVSFRNAGSDPTNTLALYTSTVLDSSTLFPSTWIHLPVTNEIDITNGQVTNTTTLLTAPAGTRKVRCQIVFLQPDYSGGSAYYDDLSLVQHAAPLLPVSLSASYSDGAITISFDTQTGADYQVVYKDYLAEPQWTPLETVEGDGSLRSVSYAADSPLRFYTVQPL